ncbi:MAG: 6-phosphogluconate dehydrogenase [Segetibacter sp.]|nr:6-phosphogluconate dehydrogenase [Segetibacter sp.]
MNTLQIGWVGLGNMGNAIVQNLLKNRCSVNVYNRTKEKEAEVVQSGALSQESLQQLVHNSSFIFTMVSDDEAVKEVYCGEQGLLSHSPGGKIFVDMSTVSPATSRYLADACSNSGNQFIDAPVSGSVQPAKEGTLIIMTGGPAEAFEKARPIFDIIGKLALHVGDNGAGSSAKLAINYFLGLNLQGLAETVLFAKDNGIRTEDMLTIINEGALANGITKGKSTSILNNEFPAAFALKHLAKDLRLAGEQGLQTPLFQPLLHSFQQALQNGLGEEDVMAIFKYLQESKGFDPAVSNIYPDDIVSDYAI